MFFGSAVFLRWVPFLRFLDQVLHRHHEAEGLDSGVYFFIFFYCFRLNLVGSDSMVVLAEFTHKM